MNTFKARKELLKLMKKATCTQKEQIESICQELLKMDEKTTTADWQKFFNAPIIKTV